jgi:hypothetical protein
MRGPRRAIDSLDAHLASIRQDQLLELALDDLESLLREPDTDPFTPRETVPTAPGSRISRTAATPRSSVPPGSTGRRCSRSSRTLRTGGW